jgi:hypothetical protein
MKYYILIFYIVIIIISYIPESNAQNLSIGGSGMNAVQALRQSQMLADDAYADQDFKLAYIRYQTLAEIGDKFAQFRLAVMFEEGQFVDQDMVEAYAWSYLAAENGRAEYTSYHSNIKSHLSSDQLTSARQRAGDLITKFGLYRQAAEAEDLLVQTLRSCTGSRVGNTCDAVEVADFTCNIQSDRVPSPSCLRIGTMGLQSIVGNFPLQIRHVRKNLRDFMDQYNPGRVELGDFELIDSEPSSSDTN